MLSILNKYEKIIKTGNLYLSLISVGLTICVLGPCLLDLEKVIHTDSRHIALIYTSRSTGFLIGAILSGILLDIIKSKFAAISILVFIMSVTNASIPWCRSFEPLIVIMFINGAALGSVETGVNVICLRLWSKEVSRSVFQGLHFSFGVGGFFAPLIAAPFLKNYNSDENFFGESNVTDSQLLFTQDDNSINYYTYSTMNISDTNKTNGNADIPLIVYPFSIISVLVLLVSTSLFVTCLIFPVENETTEKEEKSNSNKRSLTFMLSLSTCTFFLIFLIAGTEIGYSQMLTTYAVKGQLRLTTSTGSYITSAFWAAFTVTRLTSVFLSMKFSSLTLIIFDITTISISVIILFFFRMYEWALWLGSIVYGMGIASFYAATASWIDNHITMTNKIASVFSIGVAAGEMLVPFLISFFIQIMPQVFIYVLATATILIALIVMVLYQLFRQNSWEKSVKETNCKKNGDNVIESGF